MAIFSMADHFGEPDPRKIAALPADILTHWQAYLDLKNSRPSPAAAQKTPREKTDDELFADHLRILGHG
ncbi:hypothetical protein [Serratia fonticola]|uniref:hypothetical protein n=1 Tax=Serratia fonticola TaxID=47917 RepID=UPI0015C687C8|nr:hypothetical protein [Serratia fonticola]NYA15762.1 hypothetical protein [Serratia fonticola]NYA35882.1 hypothetical protein [Serratia fonticola]